MKGNLWKKYKSLDESYYHIPIGTNEQLFGRDEAKQHFLSMVVVNLSRGILMREINLKQWHFPLRMSGKRTGNINIPLLYI